MNKSLLLASMMVVALAACGRKEPTPPPAPAPAPAPAPTPAPAPAPTPTPAPTPAPTTSTAPADAAKSADSMKMDDLKKEAATAVDAANKKAQPAVKP